MDSQIRRLIASHGGYAYEIAGRVVAFFDDSRETMAFSAVLAHRAHVAVERCGTQLSFPLSARFACVVSQTPDHLPTSPPEPDPIPRRRAVWSLFRRGPARRPASQELPAGAIEHGPLNELQSIGTQLPGTPRRP